MMRALTVVMALTLVPALAAAQAPADPTGHWDGAIAGPSGQIPFEIDVVRDGGGTLIATYGQKGQGLRGLKLTQVALDGRTFTFVLFNGGPGGGSFKADILPDGKSMSGEVKATMGSAPFTASRTGDATMLPPVKNAAVTKDLEGSWTGSLDVGGTQIGLILTIANQPDGTASVLIAQSARPELQVEAALEKRGSAVSFDVPATGGGWSGTLSGTTLTGTWTQAAGSLPLVLTRQP